MLTGLGGSWSREVKQEEGKQCQGEHQEFGEAVDAGGGVHVGGGQFAVIFADVGFVEEFAEVVVGTAEAAVEDTGQGGFGVAAVGAGVATAVFPHEFQE